MSANPNRATAVLIDGENIAAGDFPRLQTRLISIPGIAITRVFGDFANASHSNWLEVCREHGVEPVLHCSPVTGKNGTDILMTIAAMDKELNEARDLPQKTRGRRCTRLG